jgi:hypothetical protein
MPSLGMVRADPGASVAVSDGVGERDGSGEAEDSGLVCVRVGVSDKMGPVGEDLPAVVGEQATNNVQRINGRIEAPGDIREILD